jgi:hypothetical protein
MLQRRHGGGRRLLLLQLPQLLLHCCGSSADKQTEQQATLHNQHGFLYTPQVLGAVTFVNKAWASELQTAAEKT